MRSELNLGIFSKKFLGELSKCSLKISKGNILINNKSFYLMEGRRMCCVYFVSSEYSSGSDHTDRQFAFFHLMNLHTGGLCSKQHLTIYIESILFVFGRMIGRNVQCFKVIVILLYFRSFYDFIAHTDEDSFYFFKSDRIRMAMSYIIFLCRKCNINDFCFHLSLTDSTLHSSLGFIHNAFDFFSGFIHHLTYLRSLFRCYILHAL